MTRTYAAITLLLLFTLAVLPGQQVNATTPTPTQVMYNRSDLLAKLAPKSYTINSMNLNYGSPADVGAQGGSWFLTVQNILSDSGARVFILGWFFVLVVLGTLLNMIRKMRGKDMKPMGTPYIQPTRLTEVRTSRGRRRRL